MDIPLKFKYTQVRRGRYANQGGGNSTKKRPNRQKNARGGGINHTPMVMVMDERGRKRMYRADSL
jgi:hypothetical protein